MNNINCILEAVGELDNDILTNAFKSKRKKHIMLSVIAAAAALSILVGFTVIGRGTAEINGKPLFEFHFSKHTEAVIPPLEDMIAMGAEDIRSFELGDTDYKPGEYSYWIAAKPSEIIKKYNITPLINDNFSEDITIDSFPKNFYQDSFYTEEQAQWYCRTNVGVYDWGIFFRYYLVDKQSGVPVSFAVSCHTEDPDSPGLWQFTPGDNEVITLNNGEKAMLEVTFSSSLNSDNVKTTSEAHFSYDGTLYHIQALTDLDGMKQILSNLGITE